MPIFSSLCQCFSPDEKTRKENNPSFPKGFEKNGRNLVTVSSKKLIRNDDQIVSVDSKVVNKCNESVLVNVNSELPNSHGGQSMLVDSEVQNSQCDISESEIFKYSELEEATDKFDTSRILGTGGYGTVYSGKKYLLHFNFQSS
jgi:hypothetical protein